MISQIKADEVQKLLCEGRHSQRKIARETGVSRGIVSAIAHGRRPNYAEIRRDRGDPPGVFDGPLERCPGCGGRAYMPCRLCFVRAIRSRRHSTSDTALHPTYRIMSRPRAPLPRLGGETPPSIEAGHPEKRRGIA